MIVFDKPIHINDFRTLLLSLEPIGIAKLTQETSHTIKNKAESLIAIETVPQIFVWCSFD